MMITVGMFIQKNSHTTLARPNSSPHANDEHEPDEIEEPHLPQRLLNLALLNRTCAPQLVAHWQSKELSGRSLSAIIDDAPHGVLASSRSGGSGSVPAPPKKVVIEPASRPRG